MPEPPTIETTDQARAGETSGHVRWVLLWGLALAVAAVALSGLAIVG